MKILLLFSIIASIYSYDRKKVLQYAQRYWNSPNHKCGTGHSACSPYSYWGSEHCGYGSNGGDCANFVSQCLLAGGHPKLKGGDCRGYPCGVEEVGAQRLGSCLANRFGWKRTCGLRTPPPQGLKVGDVLIYHKGSCYDMNAHAVVVVETSPTVKIACHSSQHYGIAYTYMLQEKPYLEWLRFQG